MKKTTIFVALALVSGSMAWAGEKLEIIKAEYGTKDTWTDVTVVVQSKVVNDKLKIEANNSLCPDPAPKQPKMLKITAKSGTQQAEFQCAERKTIEIDSDVVAAAVKAKDDALEIISAVYGAGETTVDVTEKVKEQLTKGKKITASNALFGDPAKGKAKELTIKYKLKGKEETVTVKEKQSIDLP